MSPAEQNHDILAIGASAGGIEALIELLGSLPDDLRASIFIVQHTAPTTGSRLPEVISRHAPFRAIYPVHGQEIAQRQIYVAPPDMQLLVRPGYIHVTRGPKENGHRPAIDALFRSAARSYSSRVIGVVLTGYLDDGTAGLMSIKARGGTAVVQDPESAYAPEMPTSAIRHAPIDHVVSLPAMGELLTRLVALAAGPMPSSLPRAVVELEGDEPGVPVDYVVCPACRGAITEVSAHGFTQYRCHVGHTFSMETFLLEQTEETERALWASVRALEESSALAQRMGERSTGQLRERFLEKHETLARQVELVRSVLLGKDNPPSVLAATGTGQRKK